MTRNKRSVRKAIIPAAGLGTRFLPATKAMAKEMLPIIDIPTIQLIVEEAIDAGVTDILIILGRSKGPIEDHFDSNAELEANLKAKGKKELLDLVEHATAMGTELHFKRQSKPLGLGDAVRCGMAFAGKEPFLVMLGDEFYAKVNPSKELIKDYGVTRAPLLAVKRFPMEEINRYGVIDPESEISKGLYNVRGFVEKPDTDKAPSDLAIIGRYLLTPEIFEILENQKPGAGGEIQLTDAINTLNKTKRVFAREYTGKRYDVGDKLGYASTIVEYGSTHPEIGEGFSNFIIEFGKKLESKKKKS